MRTNRFYSAFDEEQKLPPHKNEGEYRNAFQIDRDRIIHSSAFRRLQNKTQVFLSGEYDFYRTRLTHSIEVAQIGRSICGYLQQSDLLAEDCFIDPDLVESACLAHDLQVGLTFVQDRDQSVTHDRMVIHDQEADAFGRVWGHRGHLRIGTVRVMREPKPGVLSTSRCPRSVLRLSRMLRMP